MAPVTGAQLECCRNWCICEISSHISSPTFPFVLDDDLMKLLEKNDL